MKEILYAKLYKRYEAENHRSSLHFKHYVFEYMDEDGNIKTEEINSKKDVKVILYLMSRRGWVAYAITDLTSRTDMEVRTHDLYHLRKEIK